jgi:hypothetical protein
MFCATQYNAGLTQYNIFNNAAFTPVFDACDFVSPTVNLTITDISATFTYSFVNNPFNAGQPLKLYYGTNSGGSTGYSSYASTVVGGGSYSLGGLIAGGTQPYYFYMQKGYIRSPTITALTAINPTVGTITSTTAAISYNLVTQYGALSYSLFYNTSSVPINTIPTGVITLTGLTPSSVYNYYTKIIYSYNVIQQSNTGNSFTTNNNTAYGLSIFAGIYNTSATPTPTTGVLATNTGINSPRQLVYDNTRNILFFGESNAPVCGINLSTNILTTYFSATIGVRTTSGVCLDSASNLYFTISTMGVYKSINLATPTFLFTINNEISMVCDKNDNIIATSTTDLYYYNKTTATTTNYAGLSFNGLYYDSTNDQIWVTGIGIYVYQINSTNATLNTTPIYTNANYQTNTYPLGAKLATWGINYWSCIFMNATKDSNNNLLIVDYGNNAIYRATPGTDGKYGLFPGSATPSFTLLVANNSNAIFNTTQITTPYYIICVGNDAYFSQRMSYVISKITNYIYI